ncbi:MAG: cation:proton antiporter [Solirubrobacteraceae bacterium]
MTPHTAAADIGFSFADPYAVGLVFIGFAIFAAVGALSHERERAFSASLIYLVLGCGAAAVINVAGFDWVDPVEDAGLIDHLTEIAVIIALFSAGLKLDRPLTPKAWGTTARLLLLAMPLTIGLVALLGSVLLGLSAAAAILLGAILAPTDPVLAGDIGVGPPGDEDEHEPNFALTSEAGLNDGLAFPFVLAALALAAEDGTGWIGEWLAADVVYAIAGGLAIGASVGILAAWSVKRLRDHDLLAPAFDQYHALATVLVIYGVAEVAGTYGFLASFAGGLAFRRYEKDHDLNGRVHEGAELAEKLMELSVILLLGSLLTLTGLQVPGWEGWLLAVLLLVAIRPLSCIAALWGSQLDGPQEKSFVAWFGVRGVGSLFYLALAVEAGVLAPGEQDLVVWTVIVAVLISIVVHGITAGPSMRQLLKPRRAARAQPSPRPR